LLAHQIPGNGSASLDIAGGNTGEDLAEMTSMQAIAWTDGPNVFASERFTTFNVANYKEGPAEFPAG
jgi:hypothetical protein